MFREFLHKDKNYTEQNILYRYRELSDRFKKKYDLNQTQLDFLFWGYNYEFFTIKKASEDMNLNYKHTEKRIIYPLRNKDLIFNYFNKLTPSVNMDDHLFREETKFNYRVRYAITQRARNIVNRFYRELLKDNGV